MAEARWCRSCGAGPPESGRRCARCGTPLDAPDFGSDRLGRLATRGSRLLSRTVLAVAERGEEVLVLDRGEEPVAMPAAEFDRLPAAGSPPAGVRSPAGRMWAAAQPSTAQPPTAQPPTAQPAGARWPAAAAEAAALRWATTDMGTRRAAFLDRLALGRSALKLLSPVEMRWWQARAAALAGDVPALLGHLAALPPDGYDARADLLMLVFDDLPAEQTLPLLRPVTPGARALIAALSGHGGERAAAEFGGDVAEAARLAYRNGDDKLLRVLPATDEAVRHYRALRAYVATGELRDDDLRAAAREVVKLTDELSMSYPAARPAGDAVAADPSTWARLWPNAVAGKITADAAVRSRHPRFGLWLDLCGLHRAAQQGRWDEILETGPRLAEAAEDGRGRAAALNLLAYARWQAGEAGEALRLLDRAWGARPTPGLAVNAALVADDQPGLAALRYLARLAGDPAVRRNAVRRALDLWEQRGRVGELPAQVATLIHAELDALPDDDDLHRELLLIALRYERSWLAHRTLDKGGPVRPRRIARWYRARAALEEATTTERLTEAAVAVSGLWHLPRRPDWVADERTWLLDRIDAVLNEDFARDRNPAPAVEELTRHRTVDPPDGWPLLVAAGARLAAGLAERGQTPPPEVEQRLLFGPVVAFREQRASLPADRADRVAQSLGDWMTLAVWAAGRAATQFTESFVERWERISRNAALTWEENQPNVAKRQKLINELQQHADHCRRYLAASAGLPVDDKIRTDLREAVEHWTTIVPNLRLRPF